VEQAQELVKIMRTKDALTTLCGLTGVETELDFSSQGLGAGDVVLIANDISDMGAMTRLDISKSQLGDAGTMALAEGLKGNQIMIELNISSNGMGKLGAIALADIIPGMGAMTSLNLASNRIGSEGAKHVAEAIQVSVLLWLFWYQFHAHLTNGSTAVVCHCPQDMALFSVDVGNNDIPADKLQEIDQAIRSNRLRLIREDSNKSLSKMDLSSRCLDAIDATVVAEYIKDNGALTSLNLASNSLEAKAAKIIAAVLPKCT
jgi:hypothetical protein